MKTMKMIGVSVFLVLVATYAFADSSGNFTAYSTSAQCTVQEATFVPAICTANSCPSGYTCSASGVCIGGACTFDSDCQTSSAVSGAVCSGGECVIGGGFTGSTLSGGTTLTHFQTSIQTPNGTGTTLLIRPSLDTGLFTETKLTTTINNATADAGIQVCVYVDPTVVGNVVTSPGLRVEPTNCIIYDQRIQQVSNTLFSNLTTCQPAACTTNSQCAALGEGTCDVSTGKCTLASPTCNFELLLTTLSAHSFDFVVPMPGNGTHQVYVKWAKIQDASSGSSAAACVGPAMVTVQQVKNFHNDSTIGFTSN